MRDEIRAQESVVIFLYEVQYELLVAPLLLTAGAVSFYVVNYHSVTVYTSRRRCRKVGRLRLTSATRSRSISA